MGVEEIYRVIRDTDGCLLVKARDCLRSFTLRVTPGAIEVYPSCGDRIRGYEIRQRIETVKDRKSEIATTREVLFKDGERFMSAEMAVRRARRGVELFEKKLAGEEVVRVSFGENVAPGPVVNVTKMPYRTYRELKEFYLN